MRIVIVEDEIRIRDGLKKLIPKIKAEYEIVGEAINGQEGIEVVKDTKPDLIITDVRMPELDGLEMITHLIKEGFNLKIIILSAYSEFSYAKRAIGLGVSEYLLKPINIEELRKCLGNIENSLASEEKARTEGKILFSTLDDLFYRLLFRGLSLNTEVRGLLEEKYSVNKNCEFVEIVIYLGDSYDQINEKIIRHINQILDQKYQYSLIKLEQDQSILLIIFDEVVNNSFERWLEYTAMPFIAGTYKNKICFGLKRTRELKELRKGYDLIKDNLDWNIVLGSEVLIAFPRVNEIQTKPLSYPIDIENQMKKALCSLEFCKLESIVQEFIGYLLEGERHLPKDIKKACCRFLWTMLNIGNELGVIISNNFENQEYLARIRTAILKKELLDPLLQIKESFSEEKYNDPSITSLVVVKAKSLIHEFYKQGITLKEIAEKLDITPEYLSMQFYKETGTNFSSYLNDYRIKKAKGLLIGTDLKLYEIADLLGYNDAKYFSRVFKKITGQLPAEYRNIYK